jgi:hypothetical protein
MSNNEELFPAPLDILINQGTNYMEKQDYNTVIIVTVTPKEAFEGIGRVSEWWITKVDGSSHNLNDIFTVHFQETSFVTFKIVEAFADKKIVWLVTDCNLPWLKDKKEWKDTKVEWEIFN